MIDVAEAGPVSTPALAGKREGGDDGSEENFIDAKEELASRTASEASSRSELFQDASESISVRPMPGTMTLNA